MSFRTFAIFTIALPISIAIGVVLRTVDVPSPGVPAAAADIAVATPTRADQSAVRVSRRDAGAFRTNARRPLPSGTRLVPLAQVDDASRWR